MVFYRVGIDYVCDDGAEQSLAAAGGGTSADRTVSGHQYRGGGRNFHGHLLPHFQDCVPRRRSKERKDRGREKMKLITFAVPCYNSEEYLSRCMKSLLSAGTDCEIILIDDGSTDNTGKL